MSEFAERVIAWQRQHGRHDLPWQGTRDPYPVWLSEIMLQQTQVAAVIPYFQRFITGFPDVASLASADQDDVLAFWSGLGYYARARNLHRAARIVVERHGGVFPTQFEAIAALPGVGRSTAAAIAVFVSGTRQPILDGNVKRVLARFFGISGFPGDKKIEKRMWELAAGLLPERDVEAYTQGLMDLGAGICTRHRPRCEACPLGDKCTARRENRVSELPSPRPRKPASEKSTVMLILQRNGEVLLEKRPEPGIWGGLWSFPEVSNSSQAATLSRRRFGAAVKADGALPVVRHGFTHFALTITPALLRVTRMEPRAQSPGHVWLTVEDAIGAAVPAPVRAILRRLRDGG
ncbi:MAG TPA: A/G-specific adenine glycosylase [Burkholderiales bacterium]|jgi:A/G-specific adenine glycosylase|nr:A/G-specific adenine glycosylase [Burkholderiales bacterium]